MNVKDFLQFLIVKTSFPPFTYLYKYFYTTSIKISVYFLKNVEGVVTIYLHRGGSSGEIIYGLSDIDLLLIIKDEVEEGKIHKIKEAVMTTYDRLSKIIVLLGNKDLELGIYSISEFHRLFNDHPFYTYRFNIGRYAWKLLYGQDLVKELPQIDDMKLYIPASEELKVWWNYLKTEYATDCLIPRYKRKYLWYKAISEAAKVFLFVSQGKNIQDRKTVLYEINEVLLPEQQMIVDNVSGYIKHLDREGDMEVDALMGLFMTLAGKVHKDIEQKLLPCSIERTVTLSFHESNSYIMNNTITNLLEEFDSEFRNELLPYLEHIALIPQVEFEVNGLNNSDVDSYYLVLVQKSPIPIEQLRKVQSLFKRSLFPQNVEPFIVVNGSIAFSLQMNMPYHCIKSMQTSPLFFILLSQLTSQSAQGSSERDKYIIRYYSSIDSLGSRAQKRRQSIKAILANPGILKMKTVDISRFFWGAARTNLFIRSWNSAEVYIPVTSRQINGELLRLHPDDSDWLKTYHGEYRKELLGEENESYRFVSKALEFLEHIL